MRHPVIFLLILCLPSAVIHGCKKERQPERIVLQEVSAPKASLLEINELASALDALLKPLEEPVRFLSLTALHRQVILQVQDPNNLAAVIEYRYRNGELKGPKDVTLLGSGKLQDNLFPAQAADPRAALGALESVSKDPRTKDLKLKKLVMTRNLPRSRDIQFRVFFEGPDAEQMISADKHGRLLGELEPVTHATAR